MAPVLAFPFYYNMAKPQVIIVGGGMAGLSAAHRLLQNQGFSPYKLTILEASDRFGGRIHTVSFGRPSDRVVELGANWIHGGVPANPVYTVAAEHGLLAGEVHLLNRRVGDYYTPSGKVVDRELAYKAYDIFVSIDIEASKIGKSTQYSNWSLGDYIDRRLAEELKNQFSADQRSTAESVFNCMVNYLSGHIGDTLEKMSLTEYGEYKEMPGGDVKIPSGYRAVLQAIVDELPQDCIVYGARVKKIVWSESDTDVAPTQIKLECTNGDVYKADHVILTVSLGHLKHYQTDLFEPRLPDKKATAIKKLGFGRVNKVFLEYKKPFWASGFECIRLAWTNEAMAQSGADWVNGIFGFDRVLNNPNVLVGWLSGPAAASMEKLTDQQIMSDCTQVLRQFTGNPLIPKPYRVVHSSWCTNELTLGSYSFLPRGCSHEEIGRLAEPLPSTSMPQILFAGEATHPNYFSTVHAAMLSGIREADRIIDIYSKEA